MIVKSVILSDNFRHRIILDRRMLKSLFVYTARIICSYSLPNNYNAYIKVDLGYLKSLIEVTFSELIDQLQVRLWRVLNSHDIFGKLQVVK